VHALCGYAATLSAVMAASKIGGHIDMLVGGASCGAVAEQAAKLPGIRKVFCADAAVFGKPVAEDMEKLILQIHVCPHLFSPSYTSFNVVYTWCFRYGAFRRLVVLWLHI